MNKTFFLVAMIALMVTAGRSQSWSANGVAGEGDVVKQEITLPALEGIDLGFSGNVILTPGSPQKIVVEGQQNIIDLIKRDVNSGVWRIGFSKNVKDYKEVTVYITVPSVRQVSLTGSGNIRSKGAFAGIDKLDVSVSGSGDIQFEAQARDMYLHLSGSGDVEMMGSTNSLNIAISGSGDVNASSLKSSSCKVQISGSGDASVQVNGDLDTSISGSGDVHYKGEANVTAKISGSGEVSKL